MHRLMKGGGRFRSVYDLRVPKQRIALTGEAFPADLDRTRSSSGRSRFLGAIGALHR